MYPVRGTLLITSVSISITFDLICLDLLNVSDSGLCLCFADARLDLSDEDTAVALALTECSARPYAELLRSDIPTSSGLKSAKSSVSKPLPPSNPGVSSTGAAVAAPTRGEILVHLKGISRKPRSAKRKKTDSPQRDQPIHVKVRKLEVPSSPSAQRSERVSPSPASPVLETEQGSPLLAEVPPILASLPFSESIAEAGNPSSVDDTQPLAAMPLTIWKDPSENIKSSPAKSMEPTRRKTKTMTAGNTDSLLSNAELAAGAVSSILKDSDVAKLKVLPVDEVLASSFQGLALVSL